MGRPGLFGIGGTSLPAAPPHPRKSLALLLLILENLSFLNNTYTGMNQQLKNKLAKLPQSSGIYLFKNAKSKIIYVGKAAVLKNRAKSYFLKSKLFDYKTTQLIQEIEDIEWIETAGEIEALFLEAELIKRYKPKYNIDLKDEKSHLFVRISADKYPTLSLVRRPLDDGAKYFGPYLSAYPLRKALRMLRKIFPYSTHNVMPKRACLDYHLGLCPGLEAGKTSLAEYKENLKKLSMYLSGRRTQLISQLKKQMQAASKAQKFEEAAKLRNQVVALESLKNQIVFGDKELFNARRDEALRRLQNLVGLGEPPKRIEGYDISHISGTDNVASMVVFIDGVPAKSEYRRFKMGQAGNDDFAHMREVIKRRLKNEKWPMADLMVIDGGKGQLSAASEAMEHANKNIPVIGLAKRYETIMLPAFDDNLKVKKYTEVRLAKDMPHLQLLMRLRDEAHRFGLSYHTLLRAKRQTASKLESIPGVGPATRKKLIKHFGSLAGVKRATPKQLQSVVGEAIASRVRQNL